MKELQQQQEDGETAAAGDRCRCICGTWASTQRSPAGPPGEAEKGPRKTDGGRPPVSYEALTAETIPIDGSSYSIHPLLDPHPHTAAAATTTAAATQAADSSSSKELRFEVVAALDISEAACAVYRRNFCNRQQQQQQPQQQQQQQHPENNKKGRRAAAEVASICRSVGIERLPLSFFRDLKAKLWVLAPPCQPFARRGLQRDCEDARCCSLQQLISVLQQMQEEDLPRFFLLENVGGFECSDACELLMQTLLDKHYKDVFTFLLNPLHFGIPNCRTRCFILARKSDANRDGPYAQWLTSIAPYTPGGGGDGGGRGRGGDGGDRGGCVKGRRPVVLDRIPGLYSSQAFFCCPIWPLEAFLEHSLPPRCSSSNNNSNNSNKGSSSSSSSSSECSTSGGQTTASVALSPPTEGPGAATPVSLAAATPPSAPSPPPPPQQQQQQQQQEEEERMCMLELTGEQKKKAWHMVDLVEANSKRSSCFTRNYGRSCLAQYGSILLLGNSQQQQQQQQQLQQHRRRNVELHDLLPSEIRCRFFSVREQLNLHGFPSWFSFTDQQQQQQQQEQKQQQQQEQQQFRRMIGNSLNVYLVAMLLDFLIGDDDL